MYTRQSTGQQKMNSPNIAGLPIQTYLLLYSLQVKLAHHQHL